MTIKPIWDNSKTYKTEEGYFHTPEVPCPYGVRNLEEEPCYEGNEKK